MQQAKQHWDEAFIDRMRCAMNDMKENVNVHRESTQQRRLTSWRSLDEVVRAVEETNQSDRETFRQRHG